MINITGLTSVQNTQKTEKKKSSSATGAAFAALLVQEAASDEAVHDASAVAGMGTVLAAQTLTMDSEGRARNRRAVEKGGQLLDKLEEVRTEILTGSIAKQDLYSLSKMAGETKDLASDPALMEILAEIELRAEVEIAKLTKS
ncbi:MAG: flagellar assembly protein FliX [Alphaproteobacteria bacterium]|nr:flagellar assembly protein FliX [Alphaproteobacteria bacterium]